MPVYSGILCVTMRALTTAFQVEADTLEEAIELARAEGTEPYGFDLDECPEVEGDEIALIREIDGDEIDGDDIEIDLRKPGEPFSWEACSLVKQIAKSADIPDTALLLDDRERLIAEIEAWRTFQSRARAALKQEEIA